MHVSCLLYRGALNVEIGLNIKIFLLLCFFNVGVKCILGHQQDLEEVG